MPKVRVTWFSNIRTVLGIFRPVRHLHVRISVGLGMLGQASGIHRETGRAKADAVEVINAKRCRVGRPEEKRIWRVI